MVAIKCVSYLNAIHVCCSLKHKLKAILVMIMVIWMTTTTTMNQVSYHYLSLCHLVIVLTNLTKTAPETALYMLYTSSCGVYIKQRPPNSNNCSCFLVNNISVFIVMHIHL